MKKMKFDAAIIGGGVVGSAIAWKLASKGAKTVLLEKDDICSGASCTNPGFCVLSYRENALTMSLALRQQRQWESLQDEIGDVEYEATGGLIPLTDESQEEALSKLCSHAKKLGLDDIGLISAKEAINLEPALSETRIIGACWCPGEGRVNPFKLNLRMADKAKSLGAKLMPHTPLEKMIVENGRVKTLITPGGEIEAELVILATGAWTKDAAKMAGVSVPVFYERGEAMVSMPVAPLLKRIITDGALFTGAPDERGFVIGAALTQTKDGNVVIAQATTRPSNYDKSNTLEGMKRVAERALYLFPTLNELEIIRMWSGLVSYTADKQPIFGIYRDIENLFIVNSFHSAIAISPLIAEMVADYWKTGIIPQEAKAYTPNRFNT
ncbi:MAG: FAD-binding oxidoreductase [Lachnospiraceae bacterium]|jgi:glycine/D-amino acid oxidase-like deaminating enzyme|nr:FAD-binding oxidoreductase [Lachnospiraceae bacterium]